MPRRRALLLAPLALPAVARAQAWPARPIRLIVPFAPAGSSDVVGRMLADRLGKVLPQPVVVENRAGAAGTVGVDATVRSAPDGYTIVIITANQAINETLQKSQPYRLLTDLAPVAAVNSFPLALAVSNTLPVRSVAELVAYAKANPAALSYATSGPGSLYHLVSERFRRLGGFEMEHVPYRNYNEGRTAVISGQPQLIFDAVFTLAPLIKAGQLRGLATTGAAPSTMLPDLPLMSATYPGFEATLWNGILAPRATPPELVARLNAAIGQVLAEPEMQKAQAEMGADVTPMTPDRFAGFLAAEVRRYAEVVREIGLQPE